MITPKVIKTEEEYQAALAHLETLMDAIPGSPEEDELELFGLLVEKYEEEHFPIDLPDPIEAIKFRMEQQGLSKKDMIAYFGSQSKVSEVLNHKRPLSLAMIRALNEELGIPAEVLLREPGKSLPARKYNPADYPFAQMVKRNFFPGFHGTLREAREKGEELLESLLSPFDALRASPVLCRNSDQKINERAVEAWQARVLALAQEENLPDYAPDKLTFEYLRDLIKLSNLSSGPALVKEWLGQRGIAFVLLDHLPGTYLDGACFKTLYGNPVVAMTLRYDRMDYFWFTLAHELAHVFLHLKEDRLAFFDETETGVQHSCNPQEVEANQLAADVLIPADLWAQEKDRLLVTEDDSVVIAFAGRLNISPAIVAGRIRWETNQYTRFTSLIGSKSVRKVLPLN